MNFYNMLFIFKTNRLTVIFSDAISEYFTFYPNIKIGGQQNFSFRHRVGRILTSLTLLTQAFSSPPPLPGIRRSVPWRLSVPPPLLSPYPFPREPSRGGTGLPGS